MGIKVVCDTIKILGIYYSNDYEQALLISWSRIIDAIKFKINLLTIRSLNLYQKAIIVNCMILSKVWYTCHTYPLSKDWAKQIEQIIFPYIWGSKGNHLKRDVIYNRENAGGLSLLNVYFKGISIFTKTFVGLFCSSGENESLCKYYCAMRFNPLFKIRETPLNVAYITAPFYLPVIDNVRVCSKIKNFPSITSQSI